MITFSKVKEHAKVLICIVAIIVAGIIYGVKFTDEHPTLPTKAHKLTNPPTSKEEDLFEIEQNLIDVKGRVEELMSAINQLQGKIEAKRVDSVRPMKVGINDYELNKWEISIAGKNILHLEAGDKLLIVNNRSDHKQSACFMVKFVRSDDIDSGKAGLYMNTESAEFLGVDNPKFIGEFELSVQRMD